jgi:hypothetical protein
MLFHLTLIQSTASQPWDTASIFIIIQSMISLAAVLMTAYFSFRLYNRGQKTSRQKEVKRLQDVRMMLYHFLTRWELGLNEQYSQINLTVSEYDQDAAKEIPEVYTRVPASKIDTMPNHIKNIKLEDVFTILVASSDEDKEKRQYLIADLYGRIEMSIQLYASIKDKTREFEDKLGEKRNELSVKRMEILKSMHDSFHEIKRDKVILRLFEELNSIKINYANKKERNIQSDFELLINPVREVVLKQEYSSYPQAKLLYEYTLVFNQVYLSIQKTRKALKKQLEEWIVPITQQLTVISDILEIEYPEYYVPSDVHDSETFTKTDVPEPDVVVIV